VAKKGGLKKFVLQSGASPSNDISHEEHFGLSAGGAFFTLMILGVCFMAYKCCQGAAQRAIDRKITAVCRAAPFVSTVTSV